MSQWLRRIALDENGNVNTVRYDQVNAMLLNVFLKPHAKIERQETTIAWQQKQIQALEARLGSLRRRHQRRPPKSWTKRHICDERVEMVSKAG
jgi:hypothetical protein